MVTQKSLRARDLALRLMAEHGLAGWTFAFDGARRRAGGTFHPDAAAGRPGRISLSVHYCERNSEEDVKDTILHEIAHALVGPGHGHDDAWKAKCNEVGARPERCYSEAVDMPNGRWRSVCPNCRRARHRHRRPNPPTGWYCKPCGPELGALTWGCAQPPMSPTPVRDVS